MWTFFLLLLASNHVFGEAVTYDAVTMTVTPMEAVRSPGSSVKVMCKSDLPLVGCNFRVWFTDTDGNVKLNQDYPVMDLSRGNASVKIAAWKHAPGGTGLYEAEYSGRGLAGKECGILFTPSSRGRYLVGCRGRATTGGWGYDFMSLYVKYEQAAIERNDIRRGNSTLAVVNGEAQIMHTAKQGFVIRSCVFFLPKEPGTVLVDRTNRKSNSPVKYEAQQNDQNCGITLKHITEEDSGLWWYSASAISSNSSELQESMHFKFIIVPRVPTEDSVTLQRAGHDGPYAPGDVLTAKCTASDSRPVAAISWLLGGETIRNDATDDAADADKAWRWPWDVETVTQTVTRTLSAADNGKVLTCRVKHPALAKDLVDTIYVDLQGTGSSALVSANTVAVAMASTILAFSTRVV